MTMSPARWALLLSLGLAACSSEVTGGGGGAGGTSAGGADPSATSTGTTSTGTTSTGTTSTGQGGQGGSGLGQCTMEGGTGSTSGGTIECGTTFSCEGGNVEVDCSAPEGGGQAACDCYREGALVGSCVSPDFATECIFPDSCCFDVFAGGGGSGISGCTFESGTGSTGAGAPINCVSSYTCDQGTVDISCDENDTGTTCTCTGPSGNQVQCQDDSLACADIESSCCAALL